MISAGMRDTTPMWNDPPPVPVISKRPSSESVPDVNLKGNLIYFAESKEIGIV
jgi:hypothetical protein